VTLRLTILLGTFLLCVASNWTTTVASQKLAGSVVPLARSTFRSALRGLSFFAFIATIVWGVVHLPFYWMLLVIFGSTFAAGRVYRGSTGFGALYSIQQVLDLLSILGAASIWLLL
jgi:hypothetical protein